MATVQELAYAAGLIDGEGTIAVPARIAVKMTDKQPIDFLHDTFGGLAYEWKPTHNKRRLFEWRINGLEDVVDCIRKIRPYSLNKSRQMDVIVNYLQYNLNFPKQAGIRTVVSAQLKALKSPNPSYVVFDLETMGLDGKRDRLLSCSFKDEDTDEPYSVWTMEKGDEPEVLEYIRDVLELSAYTVGWNSSGYDIHFLNDRLQSYGLRPAFLGSHDDCKFMYKNGRMSLENAVNELQLSDNEVMKTPIDWPTWHRADSGDMEAMEYIVTHGENDVVLTQRVYEAVRYGYG